MDVRRGLVSVFALVEFGIGIIVFVEWILPDSLNDDICQAALQLFVSLRPLGRDLLDRRQFNSVRQ